MSIYDYQGNAVSAGYKLDGSPAISAFDYQGVRVWESVDYTDYSVGDYLSVSLSQMQGFDIHDGTIFQFRANSSTVSDTMATIDVSTGTVTNNITADSDHGDSATFSREKYDPTDAFPMIYVTADSNPAIVYLNRVTKTSSQLVRTFKFPLEKTGYYAALAIDEENAVAYMLGYKKQNYQTDDGGTNPTVVSLWNMSNLTDNGDGTFTPEFISSYERPFIYVMQGLQFHDGLIWIASGYSSAHGYIYAIDPADGTLLYTVDTNTTVELEGLAWLSPTEMVYGLAGGTYKKVTFEVTT